MSLRNSKLPILNDKLHSLMQESAAVESELGAVKKAVRRVARVFKRKN